MSETGQEGDVYLIHFDEPFKHARHYIGFCFPGQVERRLAMHRKGRGSNLLSVINRAGITWKHVRLWANAGRAFERKLKKAGHSRKLCPVCKEQDNAK